MSFQAPRVGSGEFERLVANLPDVVFRLDRELRHIFISPIIEAWTGIPPQSFIGKTGLEMGMAPAAWEVLEAAARRALAQGKPEVVQFSDRGRTYRSRVVPEHGPAGSVLSLLGITEDITERKRAEDTLNEARQHLARDLDAMTRLHRLSIRFVREDLAAVLEEVVEAAISITAADMGNIQLLEPTTGRLAIAAHRGHQKWWMDYFASVAEGYGASCGAALKQRTRVVVEDVTTSPVFVGTPALDVQLRAGIRAVQSTPLVDSSGALVGMISTHYRTPRRPDERALRFLDLLARQTAEMVERARTQDVLRQNEQKLQALADSIPQLAWTARPDGFITWYNRRWYEYTGTTHEQMEGWGWQSVHEPTTLPEVLRRWRASIATGSAFEMEFPLRGADGRFRRFLTRVVPLEDDRGNVVQWFGTNTDVTELVEAQEALQEADRRKNAFLSVLSHELRNPLGPICNSVALLRRAEPGGAQAEGAVDVIDRQTAQLARLVEDLLDVSRITSGKIRLHKKVVGLAEVVRSTVDDHRVLFARNEVALQYYEDSEPSRVEVDPARLVQVIGNLLQNAVKFTPRGGHVTVSLGKNGDRAILRVTDDGVGIDRETLGRLFQAFAQADTTLDRSQGGLGLGLALAKSLVELHGGKIRASSPGLAQGSEFEVSLPLAAQPGSTVTLERSIAPRVPQRVLVIEDNRDGAETLHDLLKLEGHQVTVAHDGQQGLDAALAGDPDVVLCDIGVPSLDGYEVARRLRTHGSRARLVALTGYAAPEDVERARQAGFDEHLTKPADVEKLFAIVAGQTAA